MRPLLLFVLLVLTAVAARAVDGPSAMPPSAVVVDATTNTDDVAVVYTEQGCVGESGSSLGLLSPLAEHFQATPGAVRPERLAFSPLRLGDVIVMPVDGFDDSEVIERFFGASEDIERAVLFDALAVLETDQEVMTQWPRDGGPDWIDFIEQRAARAHGRHVVHRRGRLVSLRRGPHTIRALELDDAVAFAAAPPTASSRAAWIFQPVLATVVRHAGNESRVYSFAKRLGEEGRTAAELRALAARTPRHVMVHPGGLNSLNDDDADRAVCAQILEQLHFDAAGIRNGELALTPAALFAFAAQTKIPFVAANLESDDGRRFPPFLEFERDGRRVAVVGFVGSDDLDRLPAAARAHWKVEPVADVAQRVLRQLLRERPTAPDLVVVLTSARNEELRLLRGLSGLDVIVGDFADADLIPRHTTLSLSSSQPAGSQRDASIVVARGGYTVGAITARFDGVGLVGFDHDVVPVLQEGEVDLGVRALIAPLTSTVVKRQRILLPDAADLVPLSAEVKDAIVGPRMLSYQRFVNVVAEDAHYTDTLWQRIVANVLLDATDADVALLKSLPRGDSIRGPVPALSVESWLPAQHSVVVVETTGDVVSAAVAAIAAASASNIAPEQLIAVGGADISKQTIAGRAIDQRRRYRLVATDAALDSVVLKDILGRLPRRERFIDVGTRRVADDAGTPLLLRPLVVARLQTFADKGFNDDTKRRFVDELARERGTVLRPELRLRADELALQGSAYRNSANNLPLFGSSGETRSTTPDLYTFGVRLRADLTWDHPSYAVELGSRVLWNTVLIDVPGVVVPPQEQADDVQLWTELRLNNLRLTNGEGGVGIVPFVRAAVDSEVTATPLPGDPTKTLPHQLLLPQSVGLVATPGGVVREVRFGAVLQEDLSALTAGGDVVNIDAGVVAGLRLDIPLWLFVLQSETDVRYLVPDGDDRPTDLALRLMSTLKLVLPVNGTTNVFVFGDAFVVSGKSDVNRALGGSVIVGGGLGFADLFAWR